MACWLPKNCSLDPFWLIVKFGPPKTTVGNGGPFLVAKIGPKLVKILVRGTKIPGKFGPLDYHFQKILVHAWNNGPSAILRCKYFNDTSLCQSVCIVSESLKK